jgi:hypothetical protein
VLFYLLFVCKCVLYYCHWVSTQLQLTNISISILATLCSFPHSQQQNVITKYNPFFPNHFHNHIPSHQGPLHSTCLFPATPISLKFISSHNSLSHTLSSQSLRKKHPSSTKLCVNQRHITSSIAPVTLTAILILPAVFIPVTHPNVKEW